MPTTATSARALTAQSLTDQQLDAELDRIFDQAAYSVAETEQKLACKKTRVYGLINAGQLKTYWDAGRKITGPSLKAYVKQKMLESGDQPLNRSPAGRPHKTIASE